MTTPNITLGLCDPPEPIYLYVGSGEANGQNYLWYRYDIEGQQLYPVFQRGLTGYLTEVRITTKEYKKKDNHKLDIVVRGDRVYIVRSGLETNFTKTLLLALSQVADFSQPLTIAVAPGDETVVFGRLYDAATGSRIKAEWRADADWLDIVAQVQERLGQPVDKPSPPQPKPQVQPVSKPSQPQVQPAPLYPQHNVLIKSIRALTGHTPDQIVSWCKNYGCSSPDQLSPELCNQLVEAMVLGWASHRFESEQHARTSYQGHVQTRVAAGVSLQNAIANNPLTYEEIANSCELHPTSVKQILNALNNGGCAVNLSEKTAFAPTGRPRNLARR